MHTDLDLPGILIQDKNELGLITRCIGNDATVSTANKFAIGCILTIKDSGKIYVNQGTVASPSWNSITEISNAEIADEAVTYNKRKKLSAVTATDDGLTTGLIPDGTTFASITSAGATKAVTLPAITSAGIGQEIMLQVGANGYELLTPASSNNTINTVDSDGTNQLDVAANSLLRCIQVTATGWVAYQITATAIAAVAPDND